MFHIPRSAYAAFDDDAERRKVSLAEGCAGVWGSRAFGLAERSVRPGTWRFANAPAPFTLSYSSCATPVSSLGLEEVDLIDIEAVRFLNARKEEGISMLYSGSVALDLSLFSGQITVRTRSKLTFPGSKAARKKA
jgi:hypothetical protein